MKGAGGEVSSFSTRIHMFWEGIGLSKEALQDSDKYCTNYKGVAVIEPYALFTSRPINRDWSVWSVP